jgi:hypothetical protein
VTYHATDFQQIPAVFQQIQGKQIKEGMVSNHSPIRTDQGRHFQKNNEGWHFQQIPAVQRQKNCDQLWRWHKLRSVVALVQT